MKKALFFAILFLVIGFAEGLITNETNMLWYQSLNKPPLTPPNWLFPVAWSLLYIFMGFAFAQILDTKDTKLRNLFIFQLLLNFAWSPMFFGLHLVFAALVIILLLDMVLLYIIYMSFSKTPKTAYLLIPYLLWILFASYLNFYIVLFN